MGKMMKEEKHSLISNIPLNNHKFNVLQPTDSFLQKCSPAIIIFKILQFSDSPIHTTLQQSFLLIPVFFKKLCLGMFQYYDTTFCSLQMSTPA